MTDHTLRNVSPPLPPDPTPRSQRNSLTQSHQGERLAAAHVLDEPQPIRDAISRTIDENVPHSSPIDAKQEEALVNKITQAVLAQLQTNISGISAGIAAGLANSATPASADAQPAQHPSPQFSSFSTTQSLHSPTFSSEASIPTRYTPPSPGKDRNRHSSIGSPLRATSTRSDVTSPEPAFSGSEFDIEDTTQRTNVDRDDKSGSQNSTVIDDRGEKQHQPELKQRRESGRWRRPDSPIRTVRPRRESSIQRRAHVPTDVAADPWRDMNTVEKAWQPLFDQAGNPQPRLGHYLRGLALHLIENYEPKDSLVVTPAKMLRYFQETATDDEQYPWHTIFAQTSYNSLSTIYQKLLAQHHLVQTANHSLPVVPALTPWGFESFMTCLIQAHPNQEYRRVNRTVKQMPISSFEDKSFRFPKELSRRMLPTEANVQAAQRLVASMAHDNKIQLRNAPVMPPPPRPQAMPPTAQERKPAGRRAHSSAIDDGDLTTAIPVERERKPYTAKEGFGKVHDLESDWDARESSRRHDDMPRPARRDSNGSSGARDNLNARNRLSTGPGSAPPVSYHNIARSGRRSPPPINPYSKSEVGVPDASQYSGTSRAASDVGYDDRYSARRQTLSSTVPGAIDIDTRGKSSRGGASQSLDSNYGSLPPPLPPIATSFGSPRNEERRRSAQPGLSANDGWSTLGAQPGSFGSDAGR